jgi:hypothetical protein
VLRHAPRSVFGTWRHGRPNAKCRLSGKAEIGQTSDVAHRFFLHDRRAGLRQVETVTVLQPAAGPWRNRI